MRGWVVGACWQHVLNCRVVWHELGWKLVLCDVLSILGWKVVARLAGCALPLLVAEVNDAIWVEDSTASLALDGSVAHELHIFNFFERRVEAADRDDGTSGTNLVAWPPVPGEANSVAHFRILTFFNHVDVVFLMCFCFSYWSLFV